MKSRGEKHKRNLGRFRAMALLMAAIGLFHACASTPSEDQDSAGAENPADAAMLLGESVGPMATDVADSSAFADLDVNNESSESEASSDGMTVNSSSGAEVGGDTFYSSVGGESLKRVAQTLYSDKGFASQLLDRNPDLKGVKLLSADQKVYFDMGSAQPEPTYLTKDLLDRYAGQLADRLTASVSEKGMAKSTVTLNPGETLQDLSMRLYGTTRYWTEIYLVNHDKISNYDKVQSGMTLTVLDRSNSVAAAQPVAESPAVASTEEPLSPTPSVPSPFADSEVKAQTDEVAPVTVPTQVEPIESIQASEPVPADPVPETPPQPVVQAIPEPAPPPAEPIKMDEPEVVAKAPAEISSSNAVTRPIIYAVLVLLILGAGFYYTRSSKRPKVDMLDITSAESGARPKLTPKDSQDKIG